MADRFIQMAVKAELPIVADLFQSLKSTFPNAKPYPLNVSQAVLPYANLTPRWQSKWPFLFLTY